ncbi:TIR domain-containing protein [Rhodobacteraceae bacterium M382]|nr:TIR domain-containing protein [Rhodobacteraceae bacterium M382]
MRAFLSHSSVDKGYVEAVAESLRPGHYELDAKTFEEGGLNADEILKALKRSDLFCLFLSRNSIKSSYVDFEIAFGKEMIASGGVARMLTICLDEEAFEHTKGYVKHYNMVRKPRSADSAARLIEGTLLSSRHTKEVQSHPFVGRENELKNLEKQANDLNAPRVKALYVSGNPGAGRRTTARKFYQNQYPEVGGLPPQIELDDFEGYDDIFRAVLSALRPNISILELRDRVLAFGAMDQEEKAQEIATEISGVLEDREALYVVDSGGLLRDNGALQPEFGKVLDYVASKPHPPLVFISPRMVPFKLRRQARDVAYCSISTLSREEAERLISSLLKERDLRADAKQLEELVEMADQHPFNAYRMMDEIEQSSVEVFLSNPRDFIDWKHKQTSEYLRSAQLEDLDLKILAVFSIAPSLDFSSLASVVDEDRTKIGGAIQKMLELHVVQIEDDNISISPALRIASERDPRTELKGAERAKVMKSLADSLALRLEEGDAPVALLDSAILATLESGQPIGKLMEVFILPSHRVWLAKRHYDAKRWKESIRMAKEAIDGRARLSRSGAVAACRYLGLSAARINNQKDFSYGVSELKKVADDDWSKSNIFFLEGFNLRLKGKLQDARSALIRSYELARGNRSTSRELASVCLNLDLPSEAEGYAREAYETAQSNPYIIDILISCLIKNKGKDCVNDPEVNELLDKLKLLDEEERKSFHDTRLAEMEYLYGDNRKALKLIQQAVKETPRLFAPLQLYAKILLKDGNPSRAKEQINLVRSITFGKSSSDLRANHRPYLQLESEYYVSIGDFPAAEKVLADSKFFSDDDRASLRKEIDFIKAYRGKK